MKTWAVVLLAACLLPATTSAQLDPVTPASPRLLHELGRLQEGKLIRLGVRGSLTHTGRLAVFDRTRVSLETTEGPAVTVMADQIESLRVRGRATKTGAVIGGVAGLTFGVLAGVFVARIVDESGDPDYGQVVPITTLFFGAAGAGTGAIIGAAIPKWHLKWP